MGGEDDGAIGLAEAGEERDHLARAFDIHVGERLVEQEQLGDGEKNAGERGALAHALRVLAEEAIEIGIEADLAKSFSGREAGAAGIETAEVAEIFLGGELVVEHGRVAHVADAGAGLVGLGFAEDVDRAVGGTKKAGENAQERGFARAVFAEEDVAAAGLEIERDLAEGGKAAEELGHLIERAIGQALRLSGRLRRRSVSFDQFAAVWAEAGGAGAGADAVFGLGAGAVDGAAPGCCGAYLLAHLA